MKLKMFIETLQENYPRFWEKRIFPFHTNFTVRAVSGGVEEWALELSIDAESSKATDFRK